MHIKKMLKCYPRVGFEPKMSNIKNFKHRADALAPAVGGYCISTRISINNVCCFDGALEFENLR